MSKKILFIGYGNPGRQDDGLGPALIKALEDDSILADKVSLSSNYQLTVEDAYDITQYDTVVFVDASLDSSPPFSFNEASANDQQSRCIVCFCVGLVLGLLCVLYETKPEAFIL
ncbi:hypothetical protein A3732_01150, partial [Oleiphilus sp. HI0050]